MHKSFYLSGRRGAVCCCWCAGLLAGIFAATKADAALLSLVRLGVGSRVSIVLLLLWSFLPFLIAAYAVMIQKFEILFALVLCRCCCYGYFLWLTVAAFGSAAWLVHPLCAFTDTVSLVCFCAAALRCCGPGREMKRDLGLYLIITAIAAVMDLLAVAPFLGQLLET